MGRLALALVFAGIAVAAPVRAEPDESEAPAAPAPIDVDEGVVEMRVLLAPEASRIVVRRSLTNVSGRVGEALLDVAPPEGAAAVALRTWLPDGRGGERPFAATLLGRATADALYKSSATSVGEPGADAAELLWNEGPLLLRVQPLLPNREKHLEVELEVPMKYEAGASHLALAGDDLEPPLVELWPAHIDDEITLDGRVVPAGARFLWTEAHDVAVGRTFATPLEVDAVSLPLRSGRVLHRVAVRAAPTLERAPESARVVLAIDASRSIVDPRRLVAAAQAYLEEMPKATVHVVTFDRHARDLFPGFLPSDEALRLLSSAAIVPGNGSELGAALEAADAALLATPRDGRARRIVALSDLETRESLEPEKLPPLASGALAHLVTVDAGEPSVVRLDEARWSEVATRTGGVVWSAGVSLDPSKRGAMSRAFEELAHPLRVDHVAIHVPGVKPDDLGAPDRLDAGDGFSDLRVSQGGDGPAVVEGDLWGRHVKVMSHESPELSRTWAGLAAVTADSLQLTENEAAELARRGGVVSPTTSLVCAPAGTRILAEQDSRGDIADFGSGGIGSLGRHVSGATRGAAGRDLEAVLRAMLSPARAACGIAGQALVEIETTRDEVVDVTDIELDANPSIVARIACLREEAWRLVLPRDFAAFKRRRFTIRL